jgi:hypothetical protein
MRFLPISVILPYTDLNILMRILFLNILNQASSLRHEVTPYSQPYTKTGKTAFKAEVTLKQKDS